MKIVVALIGLTGTLYVAYISYRRWRKQPTMEAHQEFLAETRKVYRALWQSLEEVHLHVRMAQCVDEKFNGLVRDVNILVIRSGPYFAQKDRDLISDYLETLRSLGAAASEEEELTPEDQSARLAAHRELALTAEGMLPFLERFPRLRDAYDQLTAKRRTVLTRFQEVLGAEMP